MFKGDIDDLRIYNYALSTDEVNALYAEACAIEYASSSSTLVSTSYYTLDGIRHATPQKGINIVRKHYSDGSTTMEKHWIN
jgi:hypothetical protein